MVKSILLKEIPAQIAQAITDEQNRIHAERGTRLSQSATVIKMLRDYIKCRQASGFKPDTNEQ